MRRITNIPLLRKHNVKTVFSIIWERRAVTRRELSDLTSLSAPPVSGIINQLKNEGFVRITGKGDSRGGRQPDIVEFVPDAYYVMGISTGVYRIRGIVTDLYCSVIDDCEMAVNREFDEDIRPGIRQVVKELLEKFGRISDVNRIIAAGCSFAGSVNSGSGLVLNSPILGRFKDFDLKSFLHEQSGLPVYTENNVNLAALNEYYFGKGLGRDFVLFIQAGWGIGSGLVIRGDIYTGADDSALEIGHTVMQVNGKRCYCGSYGCLETIASFPAFFELFNKNARESTKKEVRNLADAGFSLESVYRVFELARSGDEAAIKVIREVGEYIGIATANMLNILNPDIVVLGGEYCAVKDTILESIRETVRTHAWPVVKDTEIVFSDYGMNADLRGAAAFAVRNILEAGHEAFIR